MGEEGYCGDKCPYLSRFLFFNYDYTLIKRDTYEGKWKLMIGVCVYAWVHERNSIRKREE